jgi:hypothetical protein
MVFRVEPTMIASEPFSASVVWLVPRTARGFTHRTLLIASGRTGFGEDQVAGMAATTLISTKAPSRRRPATSTAVQAGKGART